MDTTLDALFLELLEIQRITPPTVPIFSVGMLRRFRRGHIELLRQVRDAAGQFVTESRYHGDLLRRWCADGLVDEIVDRCKKNDRVSVFARWKLREYGQALVAAWEQWYSEDENCVILPDSDWSMIVEGKRQYVWHTVIEHSCLNGKTVTGSNGRAIYTAGSTYTVLSTSKGYALGRLKVLDITLNPDVRCIPESLLRANGWASRPVFLDRWVRSHDRTQIYHAPESVQEWLMKIMGRSPSRYRAYEMQVEACA